MALEAAGTAVPAVRAAPAFSEPAPVRRLFHDELAHGVPVRIHGAIEPAANQSI